MIDKMESTTNNTKRKILSNFSQISEKTGFWKSAALLLFAIILLTAHASRPNAWHWGRIA